MIALIGASGFVGTRLTTLLKEDYSIKIIDKNQSHFFPELTVLADVRNQPVMREVLSGQQMVVLLAAEHRDDVTPVSLYYDVNVQGVKNVLQAMDDNGVTSILFVSSVAVYGMNKQNPDESFPADPFNHYGKSKWQAEEVLRAWFQQDPTKRSLTIVRPTVIFGERNRGNVFNLLSQIASGRFLMVGNGHNVKSMAYVGNVAAFLKHCLDTATPGYRLFNYVDKPDLSTNELVNQVEISLGKRLSPIRLPFFLGMLGGYFFDALSFVTGKKLAISSIRVKKFCSVTQFDATAAHQSGFTAPYALSEGLHRTLYYEFLDPQKDAIEFISE